MSTQKKSVRRIFRQSVLTRDRYHCVLCELPGVDRQGGDGHQRFHKAEDPVELDAHHIENRNMFSNGGYNNANGISLCDECHVLAEKFHSGFSPEDLYENIGSSFEKANELDVNMDL